MRVVRPLIVVAVSVLSVFGPLTHPACATPRAPSATNLGRAPINARLTYTLTHCTFQYQFGNVYGAAYSAIRVSARVRGYECYASSSLMAARRNQQHAVFVSTPLFDRHTTDGDWQISVVGSASVFLATFAVGERRQGHLEEGLAGPQFAVTAL